MKHFYVAVQNRKNFVKLGVNLLKELELSVPEYFLFLSCLTSLQSDCLVVWLYGAIIT